MTQAIEALPPSRPRGLRGAGGMLAAALRLVWSAARFEFVIVMSMDVIQAAGVLVLLLQVQVILSRLIAANGASGADIGLNLVIFVLANVVIVIAQSVISNRKTLLGERTRIHVSNAILSVACLAELSDFDDSRFHDRLQRAATSASTRPIQLVQSLVTVGQALFTVAALWAGILIIQPWIGLCLAPVVIPIWIGGTKSGSQYFDFIKKTTASDRSRTYLFMLLTTRDPAKEIRAFNLARYLSDTWVTSNMERLGMLRTTLRRRLRSSMISSLGSNVALAAAAGLLVGLNDWKVMTLAQTATVAGALLLFSQKLLDGISSTNDFFESAPLVGDLDEFLSLEPTLRRNRSGRPFEREFGEISIEGISFTYQDADRPALDEVSLTIRAGEVVALVGENGSGKTTLAKILAGLYTPQDGAVMVDGTDLREFDSASWRESVAVLFQDYIKYALTAAENIELGSIEREHGPEDVGRAALAAGADEFLSALPDGYQTILSPQFGRGLDLSLGQWQRVALARAFYRNAPLVVLDEPSSSLDARAERALFDSVRELYRERTVLLISHRFSTVRAADRIVVLSDGKVVEQGSHTSLMALGGRYAELFSIQAAGFLEEELAEASLDATGNPA